MKKLLFLFAFLPRAGFAQMDGPIPVNSQTVDMTSFVTNAVDQLANSYSGLFLSFVQPWVRNALLAAIFMAGAAWILDNPRAGKRLLIQAIVAYAFVHFALTYYSNPMPIFGIPFSQLFRLEGKYLSAVIDIGVLDVFLKKVSDMFSTTDKPNPFNLFEVGAYYVVFATMALPEIALFVETSFAIIALGIGAVLGSIFVALYMVPFAWCKNLFWSWVHYMIKYSLYRVVASALVFVWVTAEITMINQLFNGVYSLAGFSGLLLGLVVFNVSAAISCFRIGRIVSDLTSGTAHGGGGVIGATVGAVTSVARFF